MKEVITYVAFDGTEFNLKSECEAYEANGYVSEIDKIHRRMQQLKDGELREAQRLYDRARVRYREALEKKLPLSQKVKIYTAYLNTKNQLDTSIAHYQKLKNRFKFLREKEKQNLC